MLGELKLIYDPVKRMERSEQIRTAIALAKLRFCAHALILSSIVGLLSVVVGVFIRFPSTVNFVLVAVPPLALLTGVFLMNRIVHKEKEFKLLQWRIDALSFGDSDLKRLLSLPFPVELRGWSPSALEGRLKQLDKGKSSVDVSEEKDREPSVIESSSPEEAMRMIEEARKMMEEVGKSMDEIAKSMIELSRQLEKGRRSVTR